MAKRVVKWSLSGLVLSISKALEDPKAETQIEASFDLNKLFEVIKTNEDFRTHALAYLAKQKMMDTGASEIADPDGKVTSAKKKWGEMLEGKWTGERINATGAAENKKTLAAVKEVTKVVSLEGLIIKRTLYPDTFTAEDAAKLEEFLQVAARAGKKK
jgi:hypothetical protein